VLVEQRSSLAFARRRWRQGCGLLVAVLSLLAFSSSPALAIDFTVTKTADTSDGQCNADCSLREAIMAANASPGADRIILGSGVTYTLTLGPADPAGVTVPGSGDLDVLDALTIDGNGSTIDAAGLDRVLLIQGAFLVTMNNLTVKGGSVTGSLSPGAGISVRGATLVLNNCVVTANSTATSASGRANGGGIAVVGSWNAALGAATLASLTLNSSTVSSNSGLNGGGILCVLCAMTITNSAISGNSASGTDGGGIDVVGNASVPSVSGSTLAGNSVTGAAGRGGGLSVPFGTSVSTLSRNRVVSNTALTSGAIFEHAGTATAINNWWGCNYGPGSGGAGCAGTPNSVSAFVTFTPNLILKMTASPTSMTPNVASTATADLTFNSVNADTSGGGTVPNGIAAAFSGTLGTFTTPTAPTASGKATDVYTNSGTAGSANLSAVVDGQTVSTTVTVVVSPPTVVTGAASGIGASVATLNGVANPNGTSTTAQFQYGATASYGSTTPAVSLGTVSVPVAIGNGGLTGLACQTLYHFRAVATNSGGTTNGSDATFMTAACARSILLTGNLAFGHVSLGSVATRTLTISNNGTGTLTVSSISYPPGFSGNFPNGAIPSGASQMVTVTFAPTAMTPYGGVITVNGDQESGANTIAVSGNSAATPGDYDGDGKADVAVYRPASGSWYILRSAASGYTSYQWGVSTDIPVSGDFDGDGRADVAVYRPDEGNWFVLLSSTNYASFISYQWGVSTDLPVARDYDGDGKTDIAIYRPATGMWYVLLSTTGSMTFASYQWGVSTDMPVPADYDGDGKTDIAFYRPAAGEWYVLLSSTNSTAYNSYQWGVSTDVPVPGDYDGDGRTDIAAYRPATGTWYILLSTTNSATAVDYQWGGGIPVPGDYDGDGKTDITIYRLATGVWYVLLSSTNFTTYVAYQWGVSTDSPVLRRP
jgi:CSLREA domain-containing protein